MQLLKRENLIELTRSKVVMGFVLLAFIYIGQTLFLPKDQATLERYNLSTTQLNLLLITIIIPYLVIWFIALGGYLGLRAYAASIRKSRDGVALSTISLGLLFLVSWMPLSAVFGAQTDYMERSNHGLTPTMVIINNYFNLIIMAAAFYFLYKGSLRLLGIVKKAVAPGLPQWLILPYIALAALYVFLVLNDAARQTPTTSVNIASYYLPDWLIVTTIIIPRLIIWFWGLHAIYNVATYQLKVKGSIYKEALNDTAKGLSWVIVAAIVLRCFQSLSVQLSELTLGFILLIVYALLVLMSIGYILISRGAKNLKRIEEL